MRDGLTIERVAVKPGRLSLLVRVAQGFSRYSTPALAERLAQKKPSLLRHLCLNDVGPHFGDVLAHTSLPHVLEHLIIDEQVADTRTPHDISLLGSTTWIDEEQGLARVEVNYADDLAALQALRNATTLLNEEMGRQ